MQGQYTVDAKEFVQQYLRYISKLQRLIDYHLKIYHKYPYHSVDERSMQADRRNEACVPSTAKGI